MSVNITQGTGSASVAAEVIATQQYQQIKVVGGEVGSTSVLGVNPDRSINVSVIGAVQTTGSVLLAGGNSSVIVVAQGSVGAVIVGGSVISQVIGSVVSLNTGSIITTNVGSVITVWQNSSVLAVPVGSTIAVLQNASIAGTYAEDVAHTPADRGLFILGVRNDTLASITSADNDYSQQAVGPSGETVAVDAPFTRWVSGVADLRVVLGASVTAIAAQGASVFTYVREVQVANFGSSSVLVKIAGGLGSTLGWTIAPAGGGSNFTTRYKTGENSAVTASINGTASVLVTVSGFTARI